MCKRKRSQKKSTRAVPARHPTAAAQTHARRLFSPCSAHSPANSLSLRQCGLVRSALPPVSSPLSESSAVCAAACGGWCADLQLGFFWRAICESSLRGLMFVRRANAVRPYCLMPKSGWSGGCVRDCRLQVPATRYYEIQGRSARIEKNACRARREVLGASERTLCT